MIELYNALKFIAMLFFIKKILTFNLGVVFLKSVSIFLLLELPNRLHLPNRVILTDIPNIRFY